MNRKWMTAIAVVTFGATLAVAAPNEGDGHRGHHRGAMMSERFAEKLNLTDAQKQQISAIKESSRAENAAFFESARATWQAVRAAKQANDTAKLDSLKAQIATQREQMKQIRQAEMQKINAILTPAQQATLQQLRAEREAKKAARDSEK